MKNLFLYKYNVLLTYTPRKETNLEKYEKWLIDVDNPFFNSINEVSHYSNWKVLNRLDNFDFEYFDFLTFNTLSDFNITWHSEKVKKFTSEWRRLWGQAPKSKNLHLNARVFLLENLSDKPLEFQNFVGLNFIKKALKLNNYNFRLVRSIRDEADFECVKIEFTYDRSQISSEIIGKLIVGPS
tara:strand:+ start:1467 stop:2015 length:549 start_codon:yes stop_codon:yes gene_type:complete